MTTIKISNDTLQLLNAVEEYHKQNDKIKLTHDLMINILLHAEVRDSSKLLDYIVMLPIGKKTFIDGVIDDK